MPAQQSAEREVALAVPTSARAATKAKRYFIGILLLSSVCSRPAAAGQADAIANRSGARRGNQRRVGQEVPGRNIRSESFVARRRINEHPGCGKNGGKTESAGGAALVFRVRLRHVLVTVDGVDFHFCAAIGFDDFDAGHLARQGRERDRGTNQQANAGAQDRSHFSILGAAGESRKARAAQVQARSAVRKVTRPLLRQGYYSLGRALKQKGDFPS